MKTYTNSDRNIILSFILVSMLVILLGVISVIKMIELSDLTKKLYEHPLVVTNTTQNIQTNLVSMHRYMKDVVLATNEEELQTALIKVNNSAKIIYKDFDIVFKKYLGNKEDIQSSYDLFVMWENIRTEIVDLMHKGKIRQAIAITKQKAYKHVLKLNESVDILVAYANQKGIVFVKNANETKNLSVSLTLLVVMVILVLIAGILLILLKSLSNAELVKEEQVQQLLSQSRLAQMGEMISMIAHQWRQPLGAIASTSIDMKMKMELGEFDLEKKDSREDCVLYLNTGLDNIDLFVQSLTNTIDDFRDFYKPNNKKKKSKVNISILKTLSIIKNSLKANNIQLIENYNSDKEIDFNNSEMMQVFLNIFKNSEDNFKVKNIKDAFISISSLDTEYGICVQICDNGGGIDADIQKNIFDPYFSTKRDKNGTGLGLYMSKLIVEEHHGGKITLRNTKDGVCFDIGLKEDIK